MKALSLIGATLLIALSGDMAAAADMARTQTEREVTAFFDAYLAVYNRRFGHPERSAAFRRELSDQVQMPLLQSPPISAPDVPPSIETFTERFEGFVSMLERKGVHRLEWQRREFQTLSDNKVLANNIGVGLTQSGEVVYETVSLYLLHRGENGWKIVMFSPYDRDKALRLERL